MKRSLTEDRFFNLVRTGNLIKSIMTSRRIFMNSFEKKLRDLHCQGLTALEIGTMQVNMGFTCNQQCAHCHVEASPDRTEMMEWATMERILEAADIIGCRSFDITGGAPELNPHLRSFVKALHRRGVRITVRTNLTVFQEPGMDDRPGFYRDHGVELIASMPCYLEENVCAQRGEGSYQKSIAGLKLLNALGYGTDPGLRLSLVYNPGGPFLPPDQFSLERDYRRELKDRFDISFTNLLTITNMPIGRFLQDLENNHQTVPYIMLLEDSFNPVTLESLMCRRQINIRWDGNLYDCDFNMALDHPIRLGTSSNIHDIDLGSLRSRRILTGDHCFGCTAGQGSSCGGALLTPGARA